jgi:gluconokinase
VTVVVVLGVSGVGKTTIGRALADALHFEFFEGDDLHSVANKTKMRAGIALTDADRAPWLEAIRELIVGILARGGDAVLTCSALKRAYRDILRREGVVFVYLHASFDVIRDRLARRTGHFFNPDLLASQFAALEAPRDALVVDAERAPAEIVDDIRRRLEVSLPR